MLNNLLRQRGSEGHIQGLERGHSAGALERRPQQFRQIYKGLAFKQLQEFQAELWFTD